MNKIRLAFTSVILAFAFSSMANATNVQEIKTPQGFTVWLVEDHSLPLIAANITFRNSGTAYDPKDFPGRANMAVGLLLEGAGERNSDQFNSALENHAIRLNIGLDEDIVGASLQTLSEHKDIAFSLLADALIRPRFDDEAITRVKKQTLATLIEQSESPHYKLERSWQKIIYGEHAYGAPALGTEAAVKALTKEQLQAYHDKYFTRENVIISVVGDISAAEITQTIDSRFSALGAKYQPDTSLVESPFPAQCGSTITQHDMPQTMVRFSMAGIKRKDPDYTVAYVLNHIIGGGSLGSVLSKEIRMKKGLVYSVNSQLMPSDYAASWGGMFATQHEHVKDSIQALKQTLVGIKEKGINGEELDDAKAFLTGSFILNLDSNMDIANFLSIMQRFDLGSDYINKRNSMVNAVSLKDINRVAQRLITPQNLCIVAVGKGGI